MTMTYYSERLYPAWWAIAVFTFVALGIAGTLVDAVDGPAKIVALVVTFAFWGWLAWYLGRFRVIVDDEFLRAGKDAKHALSLSSMTEVHALNSNQTGAFTSPASGGAGARVFCPYWIFKAVYIEHDEPMPLDSVREAFTFRPVWVVGTRQPDRLVSALNQAREGRSS